MPEGPNVGATRPELQSIGERSGDFTSRFWVTFRVSYAVPEYSQLLQFSS